MAQSIVNYDVFVNLGEVKLKFHTRDGGKHLDFLEVAKLPEGVSKEGFEYVFNKLLSMARAKTESIETERIAAVERKRQAKEVEQARIEAQMKREAEEHARQQRKRDFLTAKAIPLNAPFDASSMWATTDAELALKVALNVPQLQCAGSFTQDEYVPGAGHVSHTAYAFLDPEHVGAKVCPLCGNATVKTSVSQSSGVIHRECGHKGCRFVSNERPEPRRGGALIGVVAVGAKF